MFANQQQQDVVALAHSLELTRLERLTGKKKKERKITVKRPKQARGNLGDSLKKCVLGRVLLSVAGDSS